MTDQNISAPGGPLAESNALPLGLSIAQAKCERELTTIRELFLEYAESLGFSLCFQGFDKELAELPGDYAPPSGRLFLATYDGEAAGCVALHGLETEVCEMKRLFLRPQFRGKGIGRVLVELVVTEARSLGYKRMRLDTVEPIMTDAVALYRRLGFVDIPAYRQNPIAGALYMELQL